ncbi:MAG: hypothetical protein H6741_02045 [Alphaproteobacteria bacterium]|nr:hypothetical protein [Alphaproteobacteria bacterium]MCB9791485.1 hypothetical protein [Alphaproteobacteria bacterium]
MTARAQLVELLCSLFTSTEELRGHVSMQEGGEAICAALPGDKAPLQEAAGQLVSLLAARGALTSSFFEGLVRSFPLRAVEIRTAELAWEEQGPLAAPGTRWPLALVAALLLGLAAAWGWSRSTAPPAELAAPASRAPEPSLAIDAPQAPAAEARTESASPAPDEIFLEAHGAGSVGVRGPVQGETEQFTVQATDEATGVQGETEVKADRVHVKASGGATGIEGPVTFTRD